MKNIRLLDCTLRDGGYVNDWEFGHSHLINIFERLIASKMDIIELGFLDDRRPFDRNRSIMPDTESMRRIFGQVDAQNAMLVGMIDYGTCDLKYIQPREESYLDGIRVIFKKHIVKEALEYCAELKKLGYEVFAQLVSITSYSDEELMEVIKLVNEVKPYAVSIVDTYGLLHPRDLLHYYEILDEYVCEEVGIGFHAHNNFQLAYANVLAFLEKETKREIIVDVTAYGMGKSAGNAPSELVMMELNRSYEKQYDVNPILEVIEESIMEFYAKNPWGYKPFYYLSASNECHPSYVSYYQKKMNLSVSKINQALGEIEPDEKKLMYDKSTAEEVYEAFTGRVLDDEKNYALLSKRIQDRNILIIGPGKNIQLQKEKVLDYIQEKEPFIISINYLPEICKVDAVFATKRTRWQQMTDFMYEEKNKNIEVIATSDIEPKQKAFTYVFDREPLLEKKEKIMDNSFLMLLKILNHSGVKRIACAGLDGYSDKEDNYFNPKMEYGFVKDEAEHLNNHMKEAIFETYKDMTIEFVTYSHYTEVEDCHSAAF